MSDPRDIQRLVGDLLRLGTIESVDVAGGTARVKVGDLVTGDLPWLAARAGATRSWSPPAVGEQVLLLSLEGDTNGGLIFGALSSDANPAPAAAEKLDLIRFADGAIVSYDAAAHALRAILPGGGTAEIVAPGGMSITGDVTVTGKITASDDVLAGSISLKSHKHAGVQAGAAKTAVPE